MVYVRPAEGFMYPDGARIIIMHVPCAWIACLAYVVAAWNAVGVLRAARMAATRWRASDNRCAAAMEIGLMFSALTTATGSIFSRLQWGAFWSWDPRQTSILVIMLLFAAYLVLRSAVTDEGSRAKLSSAYAVVAVIPGLFLIWVLPRIVSTLHGGANQAVIGGGLDSQYRMVLYGLALPGFLGLFAWLMQLRTRVATLEQRSIA
jgi:heme exporter protein C